MKKEDDFPDLAAAAKVKETKKDKKKKEAKKQVLSLTDFLKSDTGGSSRGGFGPAARRGGGDIDLMSLPTAPRPRAEGEEPSGGRNIGGGFREYGGSRDGAPARGCGCWPACACSRLQQLLLAACSPLPLRCAAQPPIALSLALLSSAGPRRYGDDDRDGPRRRDDDGEDMGPSRAEMSDNWGADRKFTPAGPDDRGRSGGFGGGFRDRDAGGFRDRSGEGGFRDRSRCVARWRFRCWRWRRRCGGAHACCRGAACADLCLRHLLLTPCRDFADGPSRADEVDDWGKTKAFVPSSSRGGGLEERRGGFGGGFRDRSGERGGFRDRSPAAFREPSKADTEERWGRCVDLGGGWACAQLLVA